MKDIISFDETRTKERINEQFGLSKNIKKAFKYLEGKLETNKITKTFRDLKFREGKNYDWYLFKDDDVSVLVRKYGGHSTVYTYYRPKPSDENYYLRDQLTVFTMHNDRSKMTDTEADNDYDSFTLLSSLKQLIELTKKGEGHTIWNSHCWTVPEYTEVKIAFNDRTSYQIDTMIFAYSEISSVLLEVFAETDVLDKVKTLNVGDKFGSVYEIVETRAEIKDEYYHNVGIRIKRIDEFGMKYEKESKWNDVYSLGRWHYDEMFPEPIKA